MNAIRYKRGLISFAAAVCGVAAVFAVQVDVPISTLYKFEQNFGTNTLKAVTAKQEAMPEGLPTPIFWFDCTQRTGWEYETVNGTNYVIKIPSLVGDGRFLTTNVTLEGTSWTGWTAGRHPKPPALLDFPNLPGGPALDFGPNYSDQGLVFSPHTYDASEGATSELRDIGSIVAVWGSANGGGYILGGWGSDAQNYFWCRGWENVLKNGSSDHAYYCRVFGDYCGDLKSGVFMSDAFTAAGEFVGLNGTWEVAAIQGSATLRGSLGIGLGDVRSGYNRNGGCQFGEMLIFGSQLTEEQLREVSVYLKRKWLDRKTAGWNGEAVLGKYFMVPNDLTWAQQIDIAAGEKLTIQKVEGGRLGGLGATAIVKSGEGALALKDAANFAAPIKVRSGSLELGVKPAVTGTTNDLPFGVYARFDASEIDSLSLSNENGTNFIARMDNLGFGKYKTCDISLMPPSCAYRDLRPWRIGARYGSKLPLVYCSTRNVDGRFFNSFYEESAGVYKRQAMEGVATFVGVISAELGGGHIGDTVLQRLNRWVVTDSYSSQILNVTAVGSAAVSTTNCVLWIDGQRASATSGYPDRGTHVIAVQMPAYNLGTIGAENYYTGTAASDSGAHGGLIFGELVFYNRYLTDDEIVKAQAYLMKKWLGKNVPGYANVESAGIPDVQDVQIQNQATINVPEGESALVAKLTADAPVVKTGAGTLKLGPGNDTTLLSVEEGDVRIVRATPTTAADCMVAKGASLHLDANAATSIETVERSGVKYVTRWYSKNGGNFALQTTTANQPFLNETDTLNGMPVVDFGSSANQYWMLIARTLSSTRSVFMVIGSQNGGGMILGEKYNGTRRNSTDFYRDSCSDLSKPIVGSGASAAVKNGEFYLDGVKTNITTALHTGGWEQIELHTTAGVQASALATSRGNTDGLRGCMRIGEVIVYERELSEREKIATRNYLTQKWFPSRTLATLPDEAVIDTTLTVAAIDVNEDQTVDTADPIEALKLNGAATLVKTGPATLKVNDFASFAGTIDVREGTLETGAALPVEPALKDEGRLVHFDATYGAQTVTNADLSITVTNWLDRTGNRNAEPRGSASVAFMPWGMKGNPAIDMPPGVSLWWKKDGAYASLDNIGTVFWIIGSQNGGGFVLGGGTQVDTGNGKEAYYPWHRGLDHQGQGAGYHGDPIYSGSGSYIVGDGTIRLNGEVIDKWATGLSGAWDQMTWIATTNSSGVTRLAPAAGFAFDGREYRYGCQRLAEVIIYNHRLTDAEVAGVEAYLNAKWGFAESARTGAGTIVLAAGTTLKTNGDQYVNKLGGSGAVSGDVTVKNFVADTTAAGLTVDGVLTIAANPTVELKNLPQVGLDTLRITVVAAASSFAGTDNLADAVFTGETFSEGFKAKLAVADGKLVVTFVRAGMTLFIR